LEDLVTSIFTSPSRWIGLSEGTGEEDVYKVLMEKLQGKEQVEGHGTVGMTLIKGGWEI
jgi:hypothetical protein